MNIFEQFDQFAFKCINMDYHNQWLDTVLPVVRNAKTSIPLYVFLVVYALTRFKQNKWMWLLFFGCLPILTDFISSDLIKENFFRLRPCNDPLMADKMRLLLNYKPQSSSFTSSHATNHFALATFFFYTLKTYFGKWSYLFFVWAFLICYAQVYVGVHYPLDVIAGGILGFSIGYVTALYFNKKFKTSS